MTDSDNDENLLCALRRFDTPTICNAIELSQGRRGFDNFTKSTVLCSAPANPPMVGYARTARIAGKTPSNQPNEEIRAKRLAYFRHMASGPRPALAVIEDMDYPNCVAAWWGEVHSAVHKGLGLSGALTNGVMRDLADIAADFTIIAGSIGPSHAHCHVREIGSPVEVFGLSIEDGDVIHADQHGAVVIPPEVLPGLSASIEKLLATEQIVLGPAREDGFDIEKLELAWSEFEKARV